MLIERLILIVIAATIAIVAYLTWCVYCRRKIQRIAKQNAPDSVQRLAVQLPAILFFTTPQCSQCKFQQAPILDSIATEAGIPIHRIDAVESRNLADFYGVLTVPTTVVLGKQYQPVAINHGLATKKLLRNQLPAPTASLR